MNLYVSASNSTHTPNLSVLYYWVVTLARRWLYPCGKNHWYAFNRGSVGLRAGMDVSENRKSIARDMNWTTIFLSSSPQPSHYTDYPSYRNCAILRKISSVNKMIQLKAPLLKSPSLLNLPERWTLCRTQRRTLRSQWNDKHCPLSKVVQSKLVCS